MHPPFPPWAWGIHVKGSPLAHVNRRYHWHMGQLRALLHRANSLLRGHQKFSTMANIEDEMRRVTHEFNEWKRDNAPA